MTEGLWGGVVKIDFLQKKVKGGVGWAFNAVAMDASQEAVALFRMCEGLMTIEALLVASLVATATRAAMARCTSTWETVVVFSAAFVVLLAFVVFLVRNLPNAPDVSSEPLLARVVLGWQYHIARVSAAVGGTASPLMATMDIALHDAARRGDAPACRAWLERGANVSVADAIGFDALHHAITAETATAAEVLLASMLNSSAAEAIRASPLPRVAALLAAVHAPLMQPAVAVVGAIDRRALQTEVTQIAAEGLTLDTLATALASDRDGVVLVRNFFSPPAWADWRWAETALCPEAAHERPSSCLRMRLSTQFFVKGAAYALQEDEVRRSCATTDERAAGASTGDDTSRGGTRPYAYERRLHGTVDDTQRWPNRRYLFAARMHGLSSLDQYLSEGGALTSLKLFESHSPDEERRGKRWTHVPPPHSHPPFLSQLARALLSHPPLLRHPMIIELMKHILDSEAANATGGTRRWLHAIQTRFVSIGAAGAGIQFHSHEPTWHALVRGTKLWWVGPARLSTHLTRVIKPAGLEPTATAAAAAFDAAACAADCRGFEPRGGSWAATRTRPQHAAGSRRTPVRACGRIRSCDWCSSGRATSSFSGSSSRTPRAASSTAWRSAHRRASTRRAGSTYAPRRPRRGRVRRDVGAMGERETRELCRLSCSRALSRPTPPVGLRGRSA